MTTNNFVVNTPRNQLQKKKNKTNNLIYNVLCSKMTFFAAILDK